MSTRQSPPAAGHDWAAELLSAFLDGELDEATTAAVTAHVEGCPECSHDLAELRATKHLFAALPAVRAPRSYAVLPDVPGEPVRTWSSFWQRLLGVTWRLSGAIAVVAIAIGTAQVSGISLREEPQIRYVQGPLEPVGPAGPSGPRAESGATGAIDAPGERSAASLGAAKGAAALAGRSAAAEPAQSVLPPAPAGPQSAGGAAGAAGAQAAAGATGQTIVAEQQGAVVVEKVVEKQVVVPRVAEKPVAPAPAAARGPSAADAPAPTLDAVSTVGGAGRAPVADEQVKAAEVQVAPATRTLIAATATVGPTASPTRPSAAPTPARAIPRAAPRRELAGPIVTPGVLWLIGGAAVVVLAGAAWLGERWVRGRQA